MTTLIQRRGDRIVMPGMATAHSHAFQRALRGRTQRKDTGAGSFWSWRSLMYRLAERIDPETCYQIARLAYAELAMTGVTAVGEFHYLHHAPGGAPYENRLEMAEAGIRAAQEAGIRITLIRTAYLRAGYGKTLEPAQQRFTDPSAEMALSDVDALAARYARTPRVGITLAAHSVRAVPLDQIVTLAAYARQHGLPFHMHVAEQRREIEACMAEYGKRPVEVLAGSGVLDKRFTAVHATHLTPGEIEALGAARAFVCLCRTTERDLGDGLPETAALLDAGVRLCVGVDSHAISDAFEELRAVEMDERSRTETRHAAVDATALLTAGIKNGYQAIGMDHAWQADRVYLNARDPSIVGMDDAVLPDMVVFGATPRAVDEVVVDGQTIVKDGVHIKYDEIRKGYLSALRRLGIR